MSVLNKISNITNKFSNYTNAASSVAQKVGGIFKKISGDGDSPAKIRDVINNGFISPNSQFSPTKFARMFDEPTYLTFRIEFVFDDIARNIAYNNNGNGETTINGKPTNENTQEITGDGKYFYTTMYDYMPEPFLQEYNSVTASGNTSSEFVLGDSDLGIGKLYSTQAYLLYNLGDVGRANLLYEFKRGLKDIQDNYPYYFTNISGINSLNTIEPETGVRVKEGKLEISCYEALDLRITQLIQMYRKIVWDDTYQRWVLPDMMRYFSMRIYISEIRTFHSLQSTNLLGKKSQEKLLEFSQTDNLNATCVKSGWLSQTTGLLNKILGGASIISNNFLGTKSSWSSTVSDAINTTKNITETAESIYKAYANTYANMCISSLNRVMPTIMIDCHMCEFDISDTMSYLSALTSTGLSGTPVEPKLNIKVGQATEIQSYPLNNSLLNINNQYSIRSSNPLYDANNPDSSLLQYNNTIVDDAFNKQTAKTLDYTGSNITLLNILSKQYNRYIQNINKIISNYIGNADTFLLKKFNQNKNVKKDITELSYTKNQTDTIQSITNLVTSALSTLKSYGIINGISTATSANSDNIKSAIAAASSLKALAEEIAENSQIKATAADENTRNAIAGNVYLGVLDNIISSAINDENIQSNAFSTGAVVSDVYKSNIYNYSTAVNDDTMKTIGKNIGNSLLNPSSGIDQYNTTMTATQDTAMLVKIAKILRTALTEEYNKEDIISDAVKDKNVNYTGWSSGIKVAENYESSTNKSSTAVNDTDIKNIIANNIRLKLSEEYNKEDIISDAVKDKNVNYTGWSSGIKVAENYESSTNKSSTAVKDKTINYNGWSSGIKVAENYESSTNKSSTATTSKDAVENTYTNILTDIISNSVNNHDTKIHGYTIGNAIAHSYESSIGKTSTSIFDDSIQSQNQIIGNQLQSNYDPSTNKPFTAINNTETSNIQKPYPYDRLYTSVSVEDLSTLKNSISTRLPNYEHIYHDQIEKVKNVYNSLLDDIISSCVNNDEIKNAAITAKNELYTNANNGIISMAVNHLLELKQAEQYQLAAYEKEYNSVSVEDLAILKYEIKNRMSNYNISKTKVDTVVNNIYSELLDDIISNSVNNSNIKNAAIAVKKSLSDEYNREYISVSVEDLDSLKQAMKERLDAYNI